MENSSPSPAGPTASPDMTEPSVVQKPPLPLRPLYIVLTLIVGMLMGVGGLFAYQEYTRAPEVTSYEACLKAKGSTLQESYPATCVTRDGKRFTQPIDPTDTNPIYFDPLSCNTDADCTVGIQSDACCSCPKAINASEIGKNGWMEYGTNEKQPNTKTCETFAACKPCDKPSEPVCRNNLCTFSAAATPTATPNAFTCPKNEWVDCMPGPDNAGIKFECTQDYLTWAKANCPNFKGAAL